jgi:hypothetical protein
LPQRISTLRFAGLAALSALAGISFGQSFTPLPLSGEQQFRYDRVSIPKEGEPLKGKVDFWLRDDALLAQVVDSDETTTTILIRKGGTLLRDQRKSKASSISFYGESYTPIRIGLPFVWADHPLLGRAEGQNEKGRVSYTYLAHDPRLDRRREGDIVLDGEGRLKNLFWPDKLQPETTLSISGWKSIGGVTLPDRIDQDIQQATESVSDSWTLTAESPSSRPDVDFTFEGQLDSWVSEGQRFVPINDCRVTISSCVGQTYTPKTVPLLDQIGTAGSKSLNEPSAGQGFNPVLFIPIFAGAGVALILAFRRKKTKT